MIIRVPESKKIYYQTPQLNESIFNDDIFNIDDMDNIADDLSKDYEKSLIPKVEEVLYELDVLNYEIIPTGKGYLNVDVHDHLYLPNKKLNNYSFTLLKFNKVDGNVNYSGNNLTDWSKFPKVIKGNCYANFNKLTSFDNAPIIHGNIFADKQKVKTLYPLTKQNYLKITGYHISENTVYISKDNLFGTLCDINEKQNRCKVLCEDNKQRIYKLNEVECIGNINKIFE